MNSNTPRTIAFFVGLLSLSQEILWTRLVSFAHLTKPHAFALVLCFYLLGIAAGAAAGRIACQRAANLLLFSGLLLLVSGAVDVATPWLYSQVHSGPFALPTLCAAITLTAAMKSVLFPIVHHLGTNDRVAGKGRSFSKVYFANVFGSALGPLLTGLVLLEFVSLQQSFVAVGAGTGVLGVFALWHSKRRRLASAGSVVPLVLAAMLFMPNTLTVRLATSSVDAEDVVMVLENRNGIIHTRAGGVEGDVVYGNNVYDGRINTDLHRKGNGIHRAYALAAMHPAPKEVLIIGLSGGAWTKVISEFPTVTTMDVVEINPGYLELISRYPTVSAILRDPRISFHINDGRRWLRLHPDKKYDLIVLNSIHHWRANATNLLSAEFMRVAKAQLRAGGIFYVNATGSPDVLATAAAVFPYAYRYANFVAASDLDFRTGMATRITRFAEIRDGDGQAFDVSDPVDREAVQQIFDAPFTTVREAREEAGRELEVITDENMINEYRYGIGFL